MGPSVRPDPGSLESPKACPKMATGMAGLDTVLEGGLPEGRTTLIAGGAGSGKTVLALEILYRGAQTGQAGVLVSFEETSAAIRANALSMGWDFGSLESAGRLAVIRPRIDYEAISAGDFNIKGLLAILSGQAKKIGARLIVIDAVDVLMRLFGDPKRERNELYGLHQWLTESGLTAVLTAKSGGGNDFERDFGFMEFLADCVIQVTQRIDEQISTRRLRVLKFRGSGYGSNEHPFVIMPRGIVIMPVSVVELAHKALGPSVSAGHEKLDAVLDGGYCQGASVLIAGPTGSGKTTLGCTFALAACRRGERTLYVSFEESKEALVETMLSPGIDLRPHLEDGSLIILTAMPETSGRGAAPVAYFPESSNVPSQGTSSWMPYRRPSAWDRNTPRSISSCAS
jgi:circadian clock protein KaiC